jgi:Ribosomally synthesized peptide in Bacteroidetes
MKKLEKLNRSRFQAKALNNAQQKNIAGGTLITTGETGGTDSNSGSQTGFPIRTDSDRNDPILTQ